MNSKKFILPTIESKSGTSTGRGLKDYFLNSLRESSENVTRFANNKYQNEEKNIKLNTPQTKE